jgi:hypothetical protein
MVLGEDRTRQLDQLNHLSEVFMTRMVSEVTERGLRGLNVNLQYFLHILIVFVVDFLKYV